MPETQPNPDHRQQETERLADVFARKATRDILKPDRGLSVLEALEKRSTPDPAFQVPPSRSRIDPNLADAARETRRLVDDLDQRIVRQQRRVEKIILEQAGPREEMAALLSDMMQTRDMMHAQLEGSRKERVMMVVDSPATVGINLRPPQIAALLAIIQIHRDDVRLRLLREGLPAEERAILEHLELQLESTRLEMERALADADQLLVSGTARRMPSPCESALPPFPIRAGWLQIV